jgi:hypothetical protein
VVNLCTAAQRVQGQGFLRVTRKTASQLGYSSEMPPVFRRVPAAFSLVAALVLAPALSAQAITGEKQTTLLTTARAQYYNLRMAGVKSFHCDVDVDWPGFFAILTGSKLADDDPALKNVKQIKISFTNDLTSGSTVEWNAPEAKGDAAAMDQMKNGFKQMLNGFFEAWKPSLNGTLIPLKSSSLIATSTGYVEDASDADGSAKLTFDKDLKITHMNTESPAQITEMDTTFESSGKGLILTAIAADYRQPVTAPAVHLIMKTNFIPVEGYLIPGDLLVSITNVLSFNMKFSGCTVQKAE